MLSALTAAQVPLDVPFHELNAKQRKLIQSGIPRSGFSGLDGFFSGLPERKKRRGIHAFLNRWRSWKPCSECDGSRLNAEASAIRLLGKTLHEVAQLELDCLRDWIGCVSETALAEVNSPLRPIIEHVLRKLNFLIESGLRYLFLDRPMRTLSGGEAQRVMLTTALASGLINTLYVLDEPTSGLHTADTKRIIRAVHALRDTGNTVVVVEHDPEFIAAADEVIETGPGAGEQGGAVVFQGTPRDLIQSADSATGQRLRSSMESSSPAVIRASPRRPAISPEHWIRLTGVSCHNIRELDVRFPLGVVCAVTGVSGSGKSSLIVDSLYPAVCQAKGQFCDVENSGQVSQIEGIEAFDRVLLLDQSRLPKSARSVPATWMGLFDPVRRLLAETHEGKKRNLTAASFSFNSARGGRCPVCEGLGSVTVEMQFLADIKTVCEECYGRRFRSDILEVRYRDRSVYDILEMTADSAFTFFTGQHQIQQRLNALRQAGLGYLRLGQPLSTLSGGEAQRLRIAAVLAGVPLPGSDTSGAGAGASRRGGAAGTADRTLFLLDEPSTGLHMQDIDGLMNCLDYLIQTGHSVILIEHDEYLLSQVDYRIELGPGAGRDGGRIIQSGVPPAQE
jgi:excinuclease ABC subunit A